MKCRAMESDRPLVSVVMTAFNAGAYIERSIASILGQSLKDLELIVVDDGSTDETWEVVQVASAGDARIVGVQLERNTGVVAALNVGLGRARGRLIARQDADDWSHPERLAAQVEYLDAHPDVGLVGMRAALVDDEGRRYGTMPNPFLEDDIDLQRCLLKQNCICGASVLVRRDAWERAGYHFMSGSDSAEDYDLCLRLAEVTHLANLPQVGYYYRQHVLSASHREHFRQLRNTARCLDWAYQRRVGRDSRPSADTVANYYLRAAILGAGESRAAEAHTLLQRCRAYSREVVEDEGRIQEFVAIYAPDKALAERVRFAERAVAIVVGRPLRRRRLTGRIAAAFMLEEAYGLVAKDQRSIQRRLFLVAIWRDPRLLWNRGVLGRAVRTLWPLASRSGSIRRSRHH